MGRSVHFQLHAPTATAEDLSEGTAPQEGLPAGPEAGGSRYPRALPVCLLPPGRKAEAGRPGRTLRFANCDISDISDVSHTAALPGVKGQIKSPPPYDTLPKGETDTSQTEN